MSYKGKSPQRKQRKRLLYLYVIFLTALSVSVFMMPLGIKISGKTKLLTYLSGIIFWIGFVGVIVTAAYITYLRKRSKDFKKAYPNLRQFGLIHFFKNMPAFICDLLLFVSLIGFVITNILWGTTVFPFIFLSLLIFSFGMHCMLNGSNYIYINYMIRRVTE